jgi:hypothetical protein
MDGRGLWREGVLINEEPNQGIRERKRLGYTGLDNRHTNGGKFVSPTHRPRSTPQRHYLSASGTHFC